jgi:hypothetical protein
MIVDEYELLKVKLIIEIKIEININAERKKGGLVKNLLTQPGISRSLDNISLPFLAKTLLGNASLGHPTQKYPVSIIRIVTNFYNSFFRNLI